MRPVRHRKCSVEVAVAIPLASSSAEPKSAATIGAHAIDIQFQAMLHGLGAIASVAIEFRKLAATLFADVALLAIFVSVL